MHSDSLASMTNTVDESEDVLDALFQVQAITVQVMSAIIECLVNSGEVDPLQQTNLFSVVME